MCGFLAENLWSSHSYLLVIDFDCIFNRNYGVHAPTIKVIAAMKQTMVTVGR